MEDLKQLTDMIPAIVKAFCIAHENDSDAHLAQALVYNAGRLAWRMRETGISTTEKTNISDVVTEADKAAEMFIDRALATLRPDDGVIGEEGTNRASTSGKTWVVDPVDGTYNFATGSDYFCSALALIDADNHPIFGAVHRPAMGYTWFGGKNHPTSRDGKETTPLSPAALETLSLGTYIHPTYLANAELREAWLRIATRVATLRMTGAASIDLASVACGDMGVWMQHSVADWDWLPGLALVEGAGGIGTKVTAGGVTWCIAGNKQAVEEITQLLGA
ncbi:inositol monophosphatase family protein [Corynebacterium felinum]|uniref:Fructose-1,6-bisphosphatase/inositol monophosphatase family enzyme n=2 Tax=Corynebacterium felinum TaxID=131318 RepID=A0ABU2B8N6_9CORY|nr:inositol monophosphatase family protein [Corynebacterium felinum]MDF5821107.1 inositol monophosphatase family protein [Corynebacterium felinum]MDR7354975.1 fructose-1,6-bisphosphatase/inositol monophosphatase family enzyme [Corynebacterium felinum]WJY94331.1 Inositol-1-monophosphatase [Corynebacterium felinum]